MQDSLGFSPNDLVFGHKVRGPLAVLQEGTLPEEPPQNLVDFVNGFKLYRAGELAKERLEWSQKKMKQKYDKKAELCEFWPGDRVLALLPIVNSPFQAKYSGPFMDLSDLKYLVESVKSLSLSGLWGPEGCLNKACAGCCACHGSCEC